MHTTLSAHPFVAELAPGRYTLLAERGKEYAPAEVAVEVGAQAPKPVEIRLARWIDMAARGWYSGDTHVHRTVGELRNVMPAEDLNVAFPLTSWVTVAGEPPPQAAADKPPETGPEPIAIDPTHVVWPINTEYEIGRVGGRPYTLGAVFALGQKTPLEAGVPPVRPAAEQAHRQGALLDLDKHCWPWSLMLVPVMRVDLFELANNHMWRVPFDFRTFHIAHVPGFMRVERDARGLTEWGWIDWGLKTYYALLNCGFRLRPTAGTASGVHPVPLGFSRVYVHLPGGFRYDDWLQGLREGRSFVTTGPMLMVQTDGRPPGATIRLDPKAGKHTCRLTGVAIGAVPLRPVEVVINGRVAARLPPANRPTDQGAYESPIETSVAIDGSSWVALRVMEDRPDGRIRFAHTSPVHFEVPDSPLYPSRDEIDYFLGRMEEELRRNERVLQPAALQEYRDALEAYQAIKRQAGL